MPRLKPDTQKARHEHILDSAELCFARTGFHRATIQDICREAGVSLGALYVYFASKEDLVHALFHEGYGEYGAILSDAAGGGGPFRVRLERMMREICRLHDTDTDRFRFLVMTQHGYLSSVPRDDRNPVEVICRAVAAAMDSGEIPKREPDLMALAIIGILVQPATGRLYGRLTGGLTERADELVAMAWRALS